MNVNQKIHNANLAKWLDLFKEQKASGLTVRDWCKEKGFTTHTFYYWKGKAKEAYVDSALPDIVPLHSPVPQSPCRPDNYSLLHDSRELYNSCNTGDISVSIGDIHIHFSDAVSDARLIQIVGALRHV